MNKEGEFDLVKQQKLAEKYQYIKELKKIVEEEKQKINDLIVVVEREIILEKEITIGEIFDLSKSETNGGKLTKSFINNHQGEIPVYGASKDESAVYGKVEDNLRGINYFWDCLTWNRNGSIGKVFYRKGKFSLSTDVITLIVKEEYKDSIDLLFLKYAIEKEVSLHNFGFANKAGKDKIKNMKIKIPITHEGNFDLAKQKEIAEKYKQIEEIKKNIKTELEKIENIKIDIGI
ncbi:MAG: restriction endonuclease subunit S [Candidatus Moeniiplasma glomeromycotorum]|nr:restriction endonuclease subunit S [Candidatus Moeniiplasma glomeromycotorum]